MSRIELPKQTQDALAKALREHLQEKFGVEIEPFDALALVDYVGETMGAHFYNQGLNDAQELVRRKMDAVLDEVYAIEKPVKP
jgi:uncharacterized protein (DUF2164 family)